MNPLDPPTILRSVVYIWVATEFSFLSYIYWQGYKDFKPTPIINALQKLLFFSSLVFFYLSALPLILKLNPVVHLSAVMFIPVPLIPLGLSLRKFRQESLRRDIVKKVKK